MLIGLPAGLAAVLYLGTAARTITWEHGGADGPELAAVAYLLGVAHPTGYPLYTMLGHLFTLLPIGEVAFRMALFSTACGCVAVTLVAAMVRRLSPEDDSSRIFGAGAGGLSLAVAPLFWSQANVTEVYSLNMALLSCALLLLAIWRPGRDVVLSPTSVAYGT